MNMSSFIQAPLALGVQSSTKLFYCLTHSLLRLVKPLYLIESKNIYIIVEKYYCIANTSITTKLHVLKICKLWFSFLIL